MWVEFCRDQLENLEHKMQGCSHYTCDTPYIHARFPFRTYHLRTAVMSRLDIVHEIAINMPGIRSGYHQSVMAPSG